MTETKAKRRQDQARARVAAKRIQAARAERRRRMVTATASVVAVLAVIAVLVVVKLTTGGSTGGSSTGGPPVVAATPALVSEVTGVPASVSDAVGTGGATIPLHLTGQPPLTSGGHPLVVYVGAEYCPFCAAERWAMVQALARFGTFTNLHTTYSAVRDGHIPTLTFYGSSYASRYLAFQPVEQLTNIPEGGSYKPLQSLTAEQNQLLTTYDAPPYVPSGSAGSIPFVDFANEYLISGASYDPSVLSGLTPTQVAAELGSATSPVAKNIDGTANVITATLCQLTGGQPGGVCTAPGVVTATAALRAGH